MKVGYTPPNERFGTNLPKPERKTTLLIASAVIMTVVQATLAGLAMAGHLNVTLMCQINVAFLGASAIGTSLFVAYTYMRKDPYAYKKVIAVALSFLPFLAVLACGAGGVITHATALGCVAITPLILAPLAYPVYLGSKKAFNAFMHS